MARINENYGKLPGSYLFSEIARRTAAFAAKHPDADLIRMGIGDVTRPLAPAVIEAMHRALAQLVPQPGAVIVDGNRFKPYGDIPWQTFVKGDGRFANIAAASILAKTERDLFMTEAHERFPVYAWNVNKGYPTAAHRRAIAEHGPSPLHRMTFRLV